MTTPGSDATDGPDGTVANDDAAPLDGAPGGTRWLTPGVASVGAASFFSDVGHEMASSVLPTFLGSALGAGPGALGAIEGVSDALIGLSKLAGGPLSNDPRRRASLARGGYLLTAVATAAIGLTTAVWQVAGLRALAWMSRGIRSPARDTLLVSLVPREAYGRASGVERAGDNAGAVVGPLLAAALVGVLGVRHVILLAFVPSVFAVLGISVAAREARRTLRVPERRRALTFNLRELRQAGLVRAFVPVALFELGNVATTLLLLRATDLLRVDGRSAAAATSLAIVLYAAHNGAATFAALGGGRLIDRVGPRLVFAGGTAVYVLAYLGFAWEQHSWGVLLGAFVLAGVGIGFAETAESTMVAVMLPDHLRGNGYGVLGLVQSAGDLGASLVVGVIWATVAPGLAFGYAAAWMVASLVAVVLVARRAGGRSRGR
ncbi:MFS transporter [Cellulomonas sp. P24]|uniref:MFS transporter n=1 Tax=Cellulomonas sp. P24 TaxID=2885206 RepID=UPI00216AEA1E|nr:MFS transporter [Cellulomonas sp. P24]MCR6491564.1 MFS transporter [Cellulomonas sp. P24]